MKKVKFGVLAVLLMLGLLFSGCFNPLNYNYSPDEGHQSGGSSGNYKKITIPAIGIWRGSDTELPSNPVKKASTITKVQGLGFVFKGTVLTAYDTFDVLEVPAMPSARRNASGTKITSNAHSRDFPGIIFHWGTNASNPGKQKDD